MRKTKAWGPGGWKVEGPFTSKKQQRRTKMGERCREGKTLFSHVRTSSVKHRSATQS